jgi:iron complex outermembrane receptor protein
MSSTSSTPQSARGRADPALRFSGIALAAVLVLPMGLVLSAGAIAANPDQTDHGLEEIVVTARHTSENLQVTPVAITALTGDQLRDRGITGLGDLGPSIPSVSLSPTFGGFGKSVLAFIRGVGQGDFLPSFEPGVGIYVDDAYMGTLFGSLADLTDVAEVEVLRGPQGTLFGKSNEGGAIRITTPQPKGDGSGYVEVGYGSYNKEVVRGAFDVALIANQLYLRISGGTSKLDGYVDQIDYGCAHPGSGIKATTIGNCKIGTLGADNATVLRGDLRWIASADLDMTLSAYLDDDKGEPTAEHLLAVNPFLAVIGYTNRFITANPYTTYASYTDPATGISFPKISNILTWGVNHHLDWETGWGFHVKNILSYSRYSGAFTENWGNAPVHVNDIEYRPHHDQISEELQLHGKAIADRLDWVLGGYYYQGHTQENDFIYLPEFPGGFAFYGTDPVYDRDRSGFAHGVYHLLDKLDLEAGVRYTTEEKMYTFNRFLTSIFGPVPPGATIPGFENNPSSRASTSRKDWRASLQYRWTPDVMTYLQFSTGFKGGGINPRPQTIAQVVPFAPEDLKSFEVGLKSQWLANTLRANLDAYVSDYTNLQLSIPTNVGGITGSTVSNTGRVRITGVEAEFQAAPISHMLLNASFDWLDYRILDLGPAAGFPGGPAIGDMAPYVPKFKVDVGAQYSYVMGNAGSLTPRLDWTWQSKTYNDAANSPMAKQDAYGVLNAHLLYEDADAKWQAKFEVRNLTNKFYYINEFNLYGAAGMLVGQPSVPRTFMVTLRRAF